MHQTEYNGGTITQPTPTAVRLQLPPSPQPGHYADAQLDDTHGLGRRDYLWRPTASASVRLTFRARFSHPADQLLGTAGFGFWNAPFGDPTVPWPTLPQATWFFFASRQSDLPLAPLQANGAFRPGQGWFANTLDATRPRALALAPLALPTLLLNRFTAVRRRWWPFVRQQLRLSYQQLDTLLDLTQWHEYRLDWRLDNCTFWVDDQPVLITPHSPQGPLGFVCWLDNQHLVLTGHGRGQWGTTAVTVTQWLEIAELDISQPARL